MSCLWMAARKDLGVDYGYRKMDTLQVVSIAGKSRSNTLVQRAVFAGDQTEHEGADGTTLGRERAAVEGGVHRYQGAAVEIGFFV